MEWDIWGLKQLSRRGLDICPNRRDTFSHMLTTSSIFTNLLHRHRKGLSVNLPQVPSKGRREWAHCMSVIFFTRSVNSDSWLILLLGTNNNRLAFLLKSYSTCFLKERKLIFYIYPLQNFLPLIA